MPRELAVRVVSMPSWDLFEEQDDDYQYSVLGPGSPVLSVEAATSFGWARWADESVALDHFLSLGPGREQEVLAAVRVSRPRTWPAGRWP